MAPAAKSKHTTRGQQPYTLGLSKVFTTPTKHCNEHKSTTLVAPIGLNIHQKHLMDSIQHLKTLSCSDTTLEKRPSNLKDNPDSLNPLDLSLEPTCGVPFKFNGKNIHESVSLDPKIHWTLPDATAHELYDHWIARLPSLVSSLSLYVTWTTGVHLEPITELKSSCMKSQQGTCHRKMSTIMCLFFNRTFSLFILITVICIISNSDFKSFNIESCECVDIFHVLVSNEDCNPAMLWMPWQVHWILTICGMALSFSMHKSVCLFSLVYDTDFNKGNPMQDSFHWGLGYAIQWYDSLKILFEKSIKEAIHAAEWVYQELQATPTVPQILVATNTSEPQKNSTAAQATSHELSKGECAWILQDHCLACFGGNCFGQPWNQCVSIICFMTDKFIKFLFRGSDIHVSHDGNFNHWHLRIAGKCPSFFSQIISFLRHRWMQLAPGLNNSTKCPRSSTILKFQMKLLTNVKVVILLDLKALSKLIWTSLVMLVSCY